MYQLFPKMSRPQFLARLVPQTQKNRGSLRLSLGSQYLICCMFSPIYFVYTNKTMALKDHELVIDTQNHNIGTWEDKPSMLPRAKAARAPRFYIAGKPLSAVRLLKDKRFVER